MRFTAEKHDAEMTASLADNIRQKNGSGAEKHSKADPPSARPARVGFRAGLSNHSATAAGGGRVSRPRRYPEAPPNQCRG